MENCLREDLLPLEQAQAFRTFLETQIWSTPANSPALAGKPKARVLVAAPER